MSLTKQSRHPCIAQHALCPLSAVTFGNNIYVEITVKHSIITIVRLGIQLWLYLTAVG